MNSIEKEIKVSVIIPMYNVEKYIKECLDSILNQTEKRIEVICVDDGSTDRTTEIVKKYIDQDKRIQLISQKNMYAGVARNNGIKVARGKYLLFCDGDDFYERDALALMLEHCEKTDADICICNADRYDEKTGTYIDWHKMILNYTPKDEVFSKSELKSFVFDFLNPSPCDWMYRREFVLEKELIFQEVHHANDVYFSYMAVVEAEKITVLDSKALYHYRIGIDTNLQSSKKKNPLCYMQAYQLLLETLKKRRLDDTDIIAGFVNSLVKNVIWCLGTFIEDEREFKLIVEFYRTNFAAVIEENKKYLTPYFIKSHKNIKENEDIKVLKNNYLILAKGNEDKSQKIKFLISAIVECGVPYIGRWVKKQSYERKYCRG